MLLQVKLISVQIQTETDVFSKEDPYVILRLGTEEKRSKVKEEGGSNVQFNETFTFKSQENLLKVIVMDEDNLSDDVLGQGRIDVSQYRNQPNGGQVSVPLTCDGQPVGKVILRIGSEGGNQGNQGNQWGGQNPNWNQGGQGGQGGWNQGGQGGQGGWNQGGQGGQGGWGQGGQGGQGGWNQGGQGGQGGQNNQGWGNTGNVQPEGNFPQTFLGAADLLAKKGQQ